jgi:type VI protein secretion system component Hcp
MPSDAFMEVSTWGIIGESGDESYGEKTDYQMFEISSLEFSQTTEDPSANLLKHLTKGAKGGKGVDLKALASLSGTGNPGATDEKTKKGTVTVTKAIDKSSPDLFRYCTNLDESGKNKLKFDWAVVYIRKAGDPGRPWLRIEFTGNPPDGGVFVTDFKWSVDPDAAGEEAMKAETVTFQFDRVLIKYYKQDASGQILPDFTTSHFNYADPTAGVEELP